ncbi:MAG: sigma-70 family RNA polymerase sigma factor [Clostridia bacterium]|nr:sigma-70 family RNA polymerase sigma factor [Clostridia bacterium]
MDYIIKAIGDTLNGNTDAYGIIVREYAQRLYKYALSVCRNQADAEDIVQETLIAGYLQLSSLREPEKIENWLLRILKNKAFNYIARTKQSVSLDEICETVLENESPESCFIEKESLAEWQKRINLLSPALRETALLYFWHRLPMNDIANCLGVSLGTVKRRIHDAREKLRKEHYMSEKVHTLSEAFVTELTERIKKLEDYNKTYTTESDFDDAYKAIKELISKIPEEKEAKDYSVKAAKIAAEANINKYSSEAIETYKKYGETKKASWLYLDLCWELGSGNEKYEYTEKTVIPSLLAFPENEARYLEIASHKFWMAYYVDKATKEGIDKARQLLDSALEEYKHTTAPCAYYGNTIAAKKALDLLENSEDPSWALVTGEGWKIEGDNVYLFNEPGCNYRYGNELYKFQRYVFMDAGHNGDRYFFPRTIPLEAGREEEMLDKNGKFVGIRRVIATDETVVTPAGVFENCLHIEKANNVGEGDHMWYKQGVGLVKIANKEDPIADKVLCDYDIKGGEGWLPIAVGNRWNYENPVKPDIMHEINEYVVERMGVNPNTEETVCISALNYFALNKDWEKNTEDPTILFILVDDLCAKKQYAEALRILKSIVLLNRDRESVDMALSAIDVMEEKLSFDDKSWRFCPSSANISRITKKDSLISYHEATELSLDIGVWGSRGEENRIFGVKPFRYLQQLCGTLWDDKWVDGYTEKKTHPWKDGEIEIKVTDGGRVEAPSGVFENTVRVTVEAVAKEGNINDYGHYFYNNTECGVKEYWFAKGVGVVRFKCVWGKHLESDCYLTSYRTVANENEMMPIHIGNTWRYDEKNLTDENYIARRDYKVISGNDGRYLLADSQMFTWRGSVDEYEDWKKTL